jgi:hypothetical protein
VGWLEVDTPLQANGWIARSALRESSTLSGLEVNMKKFCLESSTSTALRESLSSRLHQHSQTLLYIVMKQFINKKPQKKYLDNYSIRAGKDNNICNLHFLKSVLKVEENIHEGANLKFFIPEFLKF